MKSEFLEDFYEKSFLLRVGVLPLMSIDEKNIGHKITELLMSGDPVKKANIDNGTLKLLQKHLGEYLLVRDKDNCARVLKCR